MTRRTPEGNFEEVAAAINVCTEASINKLIENYPNDSKDRASMGNFKNKDQIYIFLLESKRAELRGEEYLLIMLAESHGKFKHSNLFPMYSGLKITEIVFHSMLRFDEKNRDARDFRAKLERALFHQSDSK